MVLINQYELEGIIFIREELVDGDLDIVIRILYKGMSINRIGLLALVNCRILLASSRISSIMICPLGSFVRLMLIIFICLILLSARSLSGDGIQ